MKVEDYITLENNLKQYFSEEILENLKNEVTSILIKYKIDGTPYIQQDVFEYIRINLAITKI